MQTAVPTDQTANHALQACERMLRPIMRLALDRGLKYQEIDELIRDLMLDEAARDWAKRNGKEPSGSQLSVTTGINRKEVKKRAEVAENRGLPQMRRSLPALVFLAWSKASQTDEKLRVLPTLRDESRLSFQSLSESVGTDVHFRSVLDELVRLGVAKEDGGAAELLSNEFVPRKDKAQFLSLGADNAHDHLNAIVSNLIEAESTNVFLEQAMWAEGFGVDACREIQDIARECWNQTRVRLRPDILRAAKAADDPQPYRVRVGFYTYFEPQTAEPEAGK